MNLILAVILVTIFSLSYHWIKRRYRFWADRGFIQADGSFPFGSLKGMGISLSSAEFLDNFYKKFKGKSPVLGIYNFLTPQIVPIDPEIVKNIMVRDFQSFHDRGLYHNKKDDPMSTNILTLDGQEWKDRRVKFTPMFTSGKMKMMFEIIDSIGDKFVKFIEKDLEKSKICEMRSWCQRFTNDNIASTAFGLDSECLANPNSEFMKMGKKQFEFSLWRVFKFLFAQSWPDLARKLGILFAPKEVGDFFQNTFLQTFENRLKNPVNRNDFVQLLLGLRDVFTPIELAAEAFLVYVGGFETSSTLMQFTLYELALDQEIQDRLRKEILDGIEENDGKITYDLLFGLKYLDMVIQETLRKYPPIPNQFRKSTKDYQIPDSSLVIPKGTNIMINTYSFHRDPEFFPNPDKFDPERFSPENIQNIQQYTFMPFGTGPRNCLGERFGLMQSKLGIAKLIQNYVFLPCEKTTIPMKFVASAPFLAPVGGIQLRVEKYQP